MKKKKKKKKKIVVKMFSGLGKYHSETVNQK